MYYINKLLGALLGLTMGFITGLMQFIYPYYLFYQNRRAAGYSWPTALLATFTIGHIFAFTHVTASGFGILNIVGNILWGINLGWAKGMRAAMALPITFHKEFQTRLPLNVLIEKDENGSGKPTLANLLQNIFRLVFQGISFASQTNQHGDLTPSIDEQMAKGEIAMARFEKLIREVTTEHQLVSEQGQVNLLPAIAAKIQTCSSILTTEGALITTYIDWVYRNQSLINFRLAHLHAMFDIQVEIQNRLENEALCNKLRDLPAPTNTALTDQEIDLYSKWITKSKLSEQEKALRKTELRIYQHDVRCQISLDSAQSPITVVLPGSDEKKECYKVYERETLAGWAKVRKEAFEIIDEPTSRAPLKDLPMMADYPPEVLQFIQQVRQVIKPLPEASAEISSPPIPHSPSQTDDKRELPFSLPQQVTPSLTKLPSSASNGEVPRDEKLARSKADVGSSRELRLKWLQQFNCVQKTDLEKTKPTPHPNPTAGIVLTS